MSSVPADRAVTAPHVERDLGDYVEQYERLPFEPLQAGLRRRRVLQQVRAAAPVRLLEIGCGVSPLLTDLPEVAEIVVLEPARAFAETARAAALGRAGVRVVEALAEDADPADLGGAFDVVVLSSLLHEVPDPQTLLQAVRTFCGPTSVLHVNVPNARSLHRQLAVAMGLVEDVFALSSIQQQMQQRATYDLERLRGELATAGFSVARWGTVLVKPFPHAGMQRLVDTGFLTPELLDGLDALAALLPEIGSELWVDAVLADG
ncbi:methyltransferase domain-containing protein [Kineococcus sp. NPDC059986]|uniref:methyltransferase domain-containing protein n=1 Tax=Kineococcus sp. NPDC059986 TaxID=3155538 RepID=UPI00344D9526